MAKIVLSAYKRSEVLRIFKNEKVNKRVHTEQIVEVSGD